MSDFIAGMLAGVFGLTGLLVCLFGYAAVRVGATADEREQYDPERRP